MRIKTLWLCSRLLVASLALVAAGCGGDDDGGDAAATAPAGRRRQRSCRAGDHGQLGHRAPVARPWPRERPHLREHPAQHHGSARQARRGPEPGSRPPPRTSRRARTARRSRSRCATTSSGRTAIPVTAEDFEYSWKRTVSPELGADYAYQFYGIVGAQDYNSCDAKKDDCAALADKMGVNAVDDKTLEVTLTTPQPWFVQQSAHHSFLAVHKPDGRQFGDKWTEAANIVTNGPFTLERVGAQREHRHRQVGRVARRGQRQADARQRPHDRGRHDRRPGLRGRRGRRQRLPAARRDPAPQARPRVRSSTRRSAPTTTASTSRRSPT